MRPLKLLLQAPSRVLWIVTAGAAALGAVGVAFACSRPSDVHESDDVKGQACLSCHSAAYNAAANPVHIGVMPQTCQDCHTTQAWIPSAVKDHRWWPIQNKHVGVTCDACHTKGYRAGDTPKECDGCHHKDYEDPNTKESLDCVPQFPANPGNHPSLRYPLACETCHTDNGFCSQPLNHDAVFKLDGRHSPLVTLCTACHAGTPPTYKGTPKDCFACHQKDYETTAQQKNANHSTFPHTCDNCHWLSGWSQGPPLSGLHPEAKFPITTGAHADPRLGCLDCHRLEKGQAAGGSNTDCTNCHLTGTRFSSMGSHPSPAIDQFHRAQPDGGSVAGYPAAPSTTNFCLAAPCHQSGEHR